MERVELQIHSVIWHYLFLKLEKGKAWLISAVALAVF